MCHYSAANSLLKNFHLIYFRYKRDFAYDKSCRKIFSNIIKKLEIESLHGSIAQVLELQSNQA